MRNQVIAGRYRLDERIGDGGMGVVWRASDLELGRVVALKQSQAGDHGQIRREARIGAGLQHPHVVAVFDAVVDEDGVRWLVMEYLPSRNLSAIIEADGPLPVADAARIGAQLANALAAMHERGVVHRDIKPGNVLVAEDGTAKLTDFGIARWAEVTRTEAGEVGGTPGYLAPEVADGQEARPSADVFSLGATLFAAVSGRSPWGTSEQGPMVQLRRAASGRLDELPEAGPLTPVLAALLAAEPARRPTARVAKTLLDEVTGASTPLTALAKPVRDRSRRRLLLTCLGLAVALIGGFATGYAVRSPEVAEPAESKIGTMGDEHTADPCALFETAAVARFGETRLNTEYGGFSECNLNVRLSQDEDDSAVIQIQLRGVQNPPPPDFRRGRLGPIQRPAPEENSCRRYVWMPDGHEVGVSAKHLDGRPADLCGMAEAVASGVLTVLAAGEVPRRAPAEANSLRTLNACDLLSPEDTARVLGVSGVKPEPDFGRWACYWEQAPLQITTEFFRTREPVDGEDGTRIRIGSRDAFVEPGKVQGDEDVGCEITIVHRRYQKPGDVDWFEIANVTVETKEKIPSERICAMAVELAGSMVNRLPPP